MGTARSPCCRYLETARGSQVAKAFVREDSALARVSQMSRRMVDIRAGFGPPWSESRITGSMRARVERRRGCMRDSWTLNHFR